MLSLAEPDVTPLTDVMAESQGETTLLHTQGLKKVYDGRAVVNGVDIEVKSGEIVGLLGPNGAGKTTTFYMIVGLVQPNGGRVMFDGKDATHEPMFMRARLGMGYLPQEESIFRRLTVRENIMAVMETQPYTRREREEQTQSLMEKFGIDHVAENLAITLSGGEKRRLTITQEPFLKITGQLQRADGTTTVLAKTITAFRYDETRRVSVKSHDFG